MTLLHKDISLTALIWAEGLPNPLQLKEILQKSNAIEDPDDEIPPPLPPLPTEDEVEPLPPIPGEQNTFVESEDYEEKKASSKERPKFKMLGLIVGSLIVIVFALYQWMDSQEQFSIRRANRMSPELFARINREFQFQGWDKKIFFKEFVPADMSLIWLVNGGFQECQIEAQFTSIEGKLLAVNDEKVSFKSSTVLKNHLAEFSNFDFSSGTKIIPGLYEVDLKATGCSWGSLAAKIGNFFQPSQSDYAARMKVVLYHKGSKEFNDVLDKLIRKKLDMEIKNQNQEELFWQDLQQKLQTLLGMTLQIEQTLVDFTEQAPEKFKENLEKTVQKYTQQSGGILSEFVIQNEKYFDELNESELSNIANKRSYEEIIRVTSKNIGFESMKIIEELQGWKKPTSEDLGRMKAKIQKNFSILKDSLNIRLKQLAEDRSGTTN